MQWKHVQPARRTMTLMPTNMAQGPNTYLGNLDFNKMLLLAIAVHVVILGLTNLMPEQKITTIPVQSLSFKIGENQRIQTFAPSPAPKPKFISEQKKAAPAPKPAPVKQVAKPAPKKETPSPAWKPATTEKSVVRTNVQKAEIAAVESKPLPAPTLTPPLAERQVPQENVAEIKKESSLLDYLMLPINAITEEKKPAIADTPQQYVRERGAAPIDTLRDKAHSTFGKSDAVSTVGATDGTGMSADQQVRASYEKTISAWIGQHKIYPASARGREGRAVLRIRIDRHGYVRYYALEESSGIAVLNSAAIDMIRRANPVPAVPENYPAGNLIEFLIPITFEAP